MILVDTSAWSIAFRRRQPTRTDRETAVFWRMGQLIRDGEALMIGAIRQELLSGVKSADQFDRLLAEIVGFHVLEMRLPTYDLAARFSNRCRATGIAAGDIDMMICAVAAEHELPILTLDRDFERYAKLLPIRLA